MFDRRNGRRADLRRTFPSKGGLGAKISIAKTGGHRRDFHLVDKAGKLRGALFVSAKGEPGVALFDQEGKSRVLLMLNADGSTVFELKDKNEQNKATFRVSTEGDPEIKMYGKPAITLLDKDQKVLWNVP